MLRLDLVADWSRDITVPTLMQRANLAEVIVVLIVDN
jgi:hypothetical protein